MGNCFGKKWWKATDDLNFRLCEESEDSINRRQTAEGNSVAHSLTGLSPPSFDNVTMCAERDGPGVRRKEQSDICYETGMRHIEIENAADKYSIIKLLGKGDVGRVFLVEEKDTRELFAMKVLLKRDMIERKKVKRVLTERDVLATAKHPFIVTLHASFQTVERLYFVMEYCAGGEFFRMLQRLPNKRLPEDSMRFYLAEILSALEFLHMSGFVHRDLKPENILLHGSGHIRLADFDLSKRVTTTSLPTLFRPSILSFFFKTKTKSSTLDTQVCVSNISTNSLVGTPEYIAPEILVGQSYTSSVDWWTVGVLAYEMMCGVTPFKGEDKKATFRQILYHDVAFPPDVQMSKPCKNLINKLLEKESHRRLGTAHGAADLKNHPFFSTVNWSLLPSRTPPLIPDIKNPLDTSNFRQLTEQLSQEGEREMSMPAIPSGSLAIDDPFRGFRSVTCAKV